MGRDETAVEAASRRYGKILMSVAVGITGNVQDAEECVNDTYLAAWNTIPPQVPDDLRAYLCRIAHNLACRVLDRRTAQKRQAELVPLTAELAEVLLPSEDAASLDEGEISRAIDRFLRTLPQEARVVFVRRYFYADSIEKTAELTGVSKAKVTQSLFRTRKKLKAFLTKEGIFL